MVSRTACWPLTGTSNAAARDPDARSSRVLSDSPDANKWERAHLTKSITEEEKMKGSIIDDTTAIGKRLDELTSKQVAVIKTAAPPPRRLPVCLRCDDTGWMKDGHNWRTCSACCNPLRKPLPDKRVKF
jgi:hypothetical protein